MNDINDFLKVKSSDPKLENKIHINITDSREKINWYIKFNLKLDENSVNNQNMFVTDRDGIVLATIIRYRSNKKMIMITPLDDYTEGIYYILTIKKEVRSENQNNLKHDIHILFKINENRVEDFIILPPNVVVPEPKFIKRRDKNETEKKTPHTKLYSFEKLMDLENAQDKLPTVELRFNPLIGAVGIVLTLISLFLNNMLFIAICGFIALLGFLHILYQVTRAKFRSDFIYNKGVRKFNKDNFNKASELFEKALKINPQNEYAEYAKSKMNYYKE